MGKYSKFGLKWNMMGKLTTRWLNGKGSQTRIQGINPSNENQQGFALLREYLQNLLLDCDLIDKKKELSHKEKEKRKPRG